MSDRDDSKAPRKGGRAEVDAQDEARRVILARRRRFVAVALTSAGVATSACEKPQPCLSVEPVQGGAAPMPCLSPMPEPEPSVAPPDRGEADAGSADAGDAGTDGGDGSQAGGDRDAGAEPPPPRVCLRVAPPPDPTAPKPCLKIAPPRVDKTPKKG